eukprot:TRINITY_DN26152_c0_g1_i1.p1 TRINITY_DN26152_c0_g1~~TRINITY_DN26152_c0_g1_i1.p1  ORF type:complete len:589 (+),score=81.66 TRINITY_DN26152_c0_g1_i1:247-2013(+)
MLRRVSLAFTNNDVTSTAASAVAERLEAEVQSIVLRLTASKAIVKAFHRLIAGLAALLAALASDVDTLRSSIVDLIWGTFEPLRLSSRCRDVHDADVTFVWGSEAVRLAVDDPLVAATKFGLDVSITNQPTGDFAAGFDDDTKEADGSTCEASGNQDFQTYPGPLLENTSDRSDALNGTRSAIHELGLNVALSCMVTPSELNALLELLCLEFAQVQCSSDDAVRTVLERLAPRLTGVLKRLLQWDSCTGLGGVPVEGFPLVRRVQCTFPWDFRSMAVSYPVIREILTKFNQIRVRLTGKDQPDRVSFTLEISNQHASVFALLEVGSGRVVCHDPCTLRPRMNTATNEHEVLDAFVCDFLTPGTFDLQVDIAMRLWPIGASLRLPPSRMRVQAIPASASRVIAGSDDIQSGGSNAIVEEHGCVDNSVGDDSLFFRVWFEEIPPHITEPAIAVFIPAVRALRQLLEQTFQLSIFVDALGDRQPVERTCVDGVGGGLGGGIRGAGEDGCGGDGGGRADGVHGGCGVIGDHRSVDRRENGRVHQLRIEAGVRCPRFGRWISWFLKRFVERRIGSILVFARDFWGAVAGDLAA